jgi:hypothetical protein
MVRLFQELGDEGGGIAAAQEVAGGTFSQELGEPRFVLNLFVENRLG